MYSKTEYCVMVLKLLLNLEIKGPNTEYCVMVLKLLLNLEIKGPTLRGCWKELSDKLQSKAGLSVWSPDLGEAEQKKNVKRERFTILAILVKQ